MDKNYKAIPYLFDEIGTETFENNLTWTFEEVKGFLETCSATQHYISKNNKNPLDLIGDKMKISWQKSDKK